MKPGRDDTLKVILRESRKNIEEAEAITDRGRRITAEQQALKILGPWHQTLVHQSEKLSISLWKLEGDITIECPCLCHPVNTVYVGISGITMVQRKTGYECLTPFSSIRILPDEKHLLEPTSLDAELFSISIGNIHAFSPIY